MTRESLLLTLAQRGYNVGFGAKAHFISYNLYCKISKFLSILTLFVGVAQLLTWYKQNFSVNEQDFVSVTLICIGIVALVVDAGSTNKDDYNKIGKRLTEFFNELHSIYNDVKSQPEGTDLTDFKVRMDAIEKEFQDISISNQFPFIHIYTNLTFFFGGSQIDWIDEQLHFKTRDKFPFFHYESLIIYLVIMILIKQYLFEFIKNAISNLKYLISMF